MLEWFILVLFDLNIERLKLLMWCFRKYLTYDISIEQKFKWKFMKVLATLHCDLSTNYLSISSNSNAIIVKCRDCTLWQYGLWSFQTGDTKLERFLHKNQHTQRIFLNFENWSNLSKHNGIYNISVEFSSRGYKIRKMFA